MVLNPDFPKKTVELMRKNEIATKFISVESELASQLGLGKVVEVAYYWDDDMREVSILGIKIPGSELDKSTRTYFRVIPLLKEQESLEQFFSYLSDSHNYITEVRYNGTEFH